MDKTFDFASAKNLNLFDEVMGKAKKQSLIKKTIDSIASYPGFHSKEEELLKSTFSKLIKKHGNLTLKNSELFLTSGNYNSYRILATYFKNKVVLLPEHVHFSHKELFRSMGKEIIEIPEKDRLLDLDQLREIVKINKADIAFLYLYHSTAPILTDEYVNQLANIVHKEDLTIIYDVDAMFTKHISNADPLLPLKNNLLNKKIIALFTLSKEFGLPGIRMGFGYACESLAQNLKEYRNKLLDIIPHFEQELILNLLEEYSLEKGIGILKERMEFLITKVNEAGFSIITPAYGINLFAESDDISDAIRDKLAALGILVRSGSEYGFYNSVRFVISQPISIMKDLEINYPKNKIIVQSEKEADVLLDSYKEYLKFKKEKDISSQEKASKLSDNIRFSSPIVWMMFKNKQKIFVDRKEISIKDFLSHCGVEKETCGKRLNFLENEFKKEYGKDLFRKYSLNSNLKRIFILPYLRLLCNKKEFIEKWRLHEFYERNGLPNKWNNYILS